MMDDGRSVDLPQGRVSYSDTGRGGPLLLVHGYPFSRRTWRKVIPELQGSYRCVAVDLLAAADTRANPEADLSISAQAQMLTDFLDALGLSTVTPVAHDSGAVIARLLATLHPQRFPRLILFDTEVPGRVVRSVVVMQRILRLPGSPFLFERLIQSPRFQRSRLSGMFFDGRSIDPNEFIAVTLEPLLRSRSQRRTSLRFAAQYDLRFADRIPHDRLTMPKLILWGDHDSAFPVGWGQELFALLPEPKTFVVIENSGILPHEKRPEEWLRAVKPFLEAA